MMSIFKNLGLFVLLAIGLTSCSDTVTSQKGPAADSPQPAANGNTATRVPSDTALSLVRNDRRSGSFGSREESLEFALMAIWSGACCGASSGRNV